MAMINMIGTELKNLFSRPATRKAEKKYPENTRGHVVNDMDLCVFCGACMMRCPAGAITVDRNGKTWTIRPMSCIQCRACVDNCPKKCLSMERRFTEPGPDKLTITCHQTEKARLAEEAMKKAAAEKAAAAKAAKEAAEKAAAEKAAAEKPAAPADAPAAKPEA
ncbi:MAG: 4Fe-4S binding protein [Lachnospiraceae bacterium]|nr:4Fe-4S binding protein [Lachnospiraceae bacterium]